MIEVKELKHSLNTRGSGFLTVVTRFIQLLAVQPDTRTWHSDGLVYLSTLVINQGRHLSEGLLAVGLSYFPVVFLEDRLQLDRSCPHCTCPNHILDMTASFQDIC